MSPSAGNRTSRPESSRAPATTTAPRKPRVLLITDSLGVPRAVPSPVPAETAWPYQVSHTLSDRFDFYYILFPGLHTGMIREMLTKQLPAYAPDIILTQVGIVDCAARALGENERKAVQRLPGFLRTPILWFVRRHYARLVRWRRLAYVRPEAFRATWEQLAAAFPDAVFRILPIAPSCASYRERNPLIDERIRTYNAILSEVWGDCLLQDLYDRADPERLFLEDNHHLSPYGQAIVAARVETELRTLADGMEDTPHV